MSRGVIGVTAGSFDLTHAGHYLMFEECKGQCDYLIVFLQTNPHIDRPEKNVPVQSTHERYLQVRACKYVDEVVVYETEQDLHNLLCSVKFDKGLLGPIGKTSNIPDGIFLICTKRLFSILEITDSRQLIYVRECTRQKGQNYEYARRKSTTGCTKACSSSRSGI
jgi:glycerol-3-phosphate cytidylyltransferase